MQKEIAVGERNIEYTLRKSIRARSVRIAVQPGGAVVVTLPRFLVESVAEKFIREKAGWLFSKIDYLSQFAVRPSKKIAREDYLKYRDTARELLLKKADYFSGLYGVRYGKISIKNQKRCWGSCSKKGNLNFNYKILFLPERIQNYIVVHEICHLKELNHGKNFWDLVSKIFPDYSTIRRELKNPLI